MPKEESLEKTGRIYKATTGVECDGFTRRDICEANDYEFGGKCGSLAQKSQSLQHGGEERRLWQMKMRMGGSWIVARRKGKNVYTNCQ